MEEEVLCSVVSDTERSNKMNAENRPLNLTINLSKLWIEWRK